MKATAMSRLRDRPRLASAIVRRRTGERKRMRTKMSEGMRMTMRSLTRTRGITRRARRKRRTNVSRWNTMSLMVKCNKCMT